MIAMMVIVVDVVDDHISETVMFFVVGGGVSSRIATQLE